MNQGRTVFSQLVEFLPTYQFQICVDRYQGNRYVKDFSCWDQFLCLAFAQLTYRESLRDIEACLRAQQPKLHHMGFRGQVSRNTLAHANEHRDWLWSAKTACDENFGPGNIVTVSTRLSGSCPIQVAPQQQHE
jgi:hypothetical protein